MGIRELHFELSVRQLGFAVLLVAVAAGILGLSQWAIGPNTATAGYLTMLFLLSVVRTGSWRARLLSVAWALAVALLGFSVGGVGIWATLIALIIVSLIQGFVTIGETALLTRSTVNLLAFAALSESGAQLWQVVLGSVIGAAVIVTFALIASERSTDVRISTTLRERLGYGIATAVGSLIIVLAGNSIGFPYVSWALLSFSIMLSFDIETRTHRGGLRIAGSAVGAILAVLVAELPAPVPTIAAVMCLVLCVAYINSGNYGLFMLFITPAILLTASGEESLWVLGAYRLESVLFATGIALVCGFVLERAVHRPQRRA